MAGILSKSGSTIRHPQDLSQIGCRVRDTADQSVANNTNTVITFNTERYDTDGIHSTSVNTSRLTAQRAGKYLIFSNLRYASNATGLRDNFIQLNGSTIIGYNRDQAVTSNVTILTTTIIYQLDVGDYVECIARQSSGGALNVETIGNYSPEFGMTLMQE